MLEGEALMTVAPAIDTKHPSAAEEDPSLVLHFDHVTKAYGKNTVVDDLTCTVRPGRVTGFLGPNGSGKSTTMKILLGLATANGGSATIGGRHYRDIDAPARRVGAALESNSFHPGRSGRNHLRVLARAADLPLSRVDETLEMVELSQAADRNAGAYSLGMRQRLGLAAALLGDPPILVLDEPGNGLDPRGVRSLRALLRSRAAKGHTVLVSSHILGEVEHLADDVIVINDGRLVVTGSLRDLQHQATVVRCDEVNGLRAALEAAGALVDRTGADGLVVRGMSPAEVGDRAFANGYAVHELGRQAGSLEEMFLTWTTNDASTSNGGTTS